MLLPAASVSQSTACSWRRTSSSDSSTLVRIRAREEEEEEAEVEVEVDGGWGIGYQEKNRGPGYEASSGEEGPKDRRHSVVVHWVKWTDGWHFLFLRHAWRRFRATCAACETFVGVR